MFPLSDDGLCFLSPLYLAMKLKFPEIRSSSLHSPFELVLSVKFSVTPFGFVRFIWILPFAIAVLFSSESFNTRLSPSFKIELLVMVSIVVCVSPELKTTNIPIKIRRIAVTPMIIRSLEFILSPIFLILLCFIIFLIFLFYNYLFFCFFIFLNDYTYLYYLCLLKFF